MKRIVLLAAALAAGCVSEPPPPPLGDNVIVYTTFLRYDWQGTFHPMNCAQAGVDIVVYDFSDGSSETYPCTDFGQPMLGGFAPGSWWVTATGYRNGQAAALYYSGGVYFTKVAGVDAVVQVDVQGTTGNLTLAPRLVGWNGTAWIPYAFPACGTANVDSITYVAADGIGIIVAQGELICAATGDPPTVTYSGVNAIDKDDLAIRMQAWQDTVPPTLVMDSCTVGFPHFGANDVAPVDLYYPIPSPCN